MADILSHAPSSITLPSACPLDCPDACSLDVKVENGRVVKMDGSLRESRHPGLYLRQGAALPGAPLRGRPAAVSGRAPGDQGRGDVRAGLLGRGARSRRGEDARGAGSPWRRVGPAFLLWRLERAAHPGHHRRPPVLPLRSLAPGPHGLRRGDRPGRDRALRQDARGRAPRFPPRPADRGLGGEPLGVGDPPGADPPGGAEGRRHAGGDRSAPYPARQEGRPLSGPPAGDGPAGGAGGDPLPLRGGARRPRVPRHARARRRGAAVGAPCPGRSSGRRRSRASRPPTWSASPASTPSPRRQ